MKKLCLTIGIAIILILSFAVVSNAAATAELQTSISSEAIQQGKEIVVTVKIDNVKGVQRGFNALTGILEYDNSIFEAVQSTDFAMQNNWDTIIYNPANKMFATAKGEGIKQGEAIFKLTLKAKSNVKPGDYSIKIKEFTVSEGIEDIVLGEKEVTITIVEKNEQVSNNTNKNETNISQENVTIEEQTNNTTTNSVNTTVTQNLTDNNKSNVVTNENTQNNNGVWIIVAVIVLAIAIVIVAYIIKKKKEN